ncbi:beta-1,4-N-acetylgalactosaminyltransferase 3 [Symphorus nematophorus]
MVMSLIPSKKMRHHNIFVLLGAVTLVGVVVVLYEMDSVKTWSRDYSVIPDADVRSWWRSIFNDMEKRDAQTWKPEYMGRANLHIFEDWCGSSTTALWKNEHYPLYPHSRTTVKKLAVSPQFTSYGLRIFGYLHPYTDGEFVFALSSDDNSEFWLSTDESPHNVQLLAYVGNTGVEWTAPGEFDKYASQTSQPLRLSSKKRYFFEVIHKQDDKGTDHVEVAWQLLDKVSKLMVIESNHISLYVDESSLLLGDVSHVPQTTASHQRILSLLHVPPADMLREDPRDTFYNVPLVNSTFLQGILPDCPYQPSYTIKGHPVGRYQGLNYIYMSYIYPNDYTRLTHLEGQDSCFYPKKMAEYMAIDADSGKEGDVKWSQTFQFNHLDLQSLRPDKANLHCNILGNMVLPAKDALPIVKDFMERLNEKHPGRFTLVRVINVVMRIDHVRGNRYLLEMEVKDGKDKLLRLTHYIFKQIHSTEPENTNSTSHKLPLCNPVGFRWSPEATVHFIIPVKNQARWIHMLIADMEQLFTETRDTNFNLIIIDYDSTDMDVRKALQESKLHRYDYIKQSGNFQRSAGLQAGIDLIKDDHSIAFLCDLHIRFPSSIIDAVRKHCVEGYMTFAPIVMRLDCGATRLDARGFWEVNGFGLLGIYVSDMKKVGGMNTWEFKDRWGGEDWELLDRILKAGLEVDRVHLRNFYHHYHSKRGMWTRG